MISLLKISFAFLVLSFTSNSFSQLSGSYTVGNGGNYPTIDAAVSAAENIGVSGQVTFNIFSGSYTEHITIDPIPGSNAVNTVTIKSQTGNPADVTFNDKDTSLAFTFRLNGSDNIIIRDLTFRGPDVLVYQRINLQLGCDNIKIINNAFTEMPTVGLLDTYDILIYPGGSKNLQISNNSFSTARNNIFIQDDSSTIEIMSNNFLGLFGGWCISLYDIKSAIVERNTYQVSNSRKCIHANGVKTFMISKNKIYGSGLNMQIEGCGNPITQSIISNNFSSNNAVSGRGIILEGQNILLIYNSLVAWGNQEPLYIYSGTSITALNNLVITNFWPANYGASFNLCDFNNYYNSGDSVIVFAGAPYTNIPSLYAGTGLDQHSTEVPVQFDSPADLHLAGTSIGNPQLAGIPNSMVTDDIDGQPRNPNHPYKGADEVVDFPLPVELASFTSYVNSNTVTLSWTTSSEINNSGFEIERSDYNYQLSMFNDQWSKIAYIKGNGTSTSQNNYNYTNKNLSSGKYKYRLKQIDFNGNFEYYNLSNEVMIGIPDKMYLSQNYPNPFNPVSKLGFGISDLGFVQLKVYNSVGKEVMTLVDEKKDAGYYEVSFNGNGLSSGIYFYRLSVDGNTIDTKRMALLK